MNWTKEKLEAHCKQQIEYWNKNGKLAQGKNELIAYFNGERITKGDAIKAHCYECMGGYADDGLRDCQNPPCPLYLYHPFNENRDKIINKTVKNSLLRKLL
jgi:hypothetical protein